MKYFLVFILIVVEKKIDRCERFSKRRGRFATTKNQQKPILFYLYHGIVSHPMNNIFTISYIDEIAEQNPKTK